ncbi:unnamed protein product [Alopecurus aequalis]
MVGELLERCTSKATTACSDGPAHAADDGVTAHGGDNEELAAQQDLVRVLPHDVIADVFRRLAPRWIAVCRCVCRDWCAGIDARRLLRADLLPLSSHGIFLHFYYHKFPELFARPFSTGRVSAITGKLDFLPNTDTSIKPCTRVDYDIEDHCNGLLLLNKYVVNPATRRWDPLPLCPPSHDHPIVMHTDDFIQTTFNSYLAFDPTVSPHYEVLIVPDACSNFDGESIDPMVYESKILSSSSPTCALRVFSSRYGGWEWRSFVREGRAAGAFREPEPFMGRRCAAYWRGALYVQRNANFVVRISLSNNSYRVISPPVGMKQSRETTRYLEKSEKGLYFAALDNYRLQVWILSDSSRQTEWIPKFDKDIASLLAPHCGRQVHKSVMLEDINFKKDNIEGFNSGENKKSIVDGELQSSFHNEYAIDNNEDMVKLSLQSSFYDPEVRILGFHPYKEIIFLSDAVEKLRCLSGYEEKKGLAYHLSTSKVEDLGNICPTNYFDFKYYPHQNIKYSFVYTPCWLGEFPRNS